jgi:hypothetical protein
MQISKVINSLANYWKKSEPHLNADFFRYETFSDIFVENDIIPEFLHPVEQRQLVRTLCNDDGVLIDYFVGGKVTVIVIIDVSPGVKQVAFSSSELHSHILWTSVLILFSIGMCAVFINLLYALIGLFLLYHADEHDRQRGLARAIKNLYQKIPSLEERKVE